MGTGNFFLQGRNLDLHKMASYQSWRTGGLQPGDTQVTLTCLLFSSRQRIHHQSPNISRNSSLRCSSGEVNSLLHEAHFPQCRFHLGTMGAEGGQGLPCRQEMCIFIMSLYPMACSLHSSCSKPPWVLTHARLVPDSGPFHLFPLAEPLFPQMLSRHSLPSFRFA